MKKTVIQTPSSSVRRRGTARGTGTATPIGLMETFVRIVDAGSLSAAAQQLETTQPTVSRRLQSLERALGVRLLQRSTHSMRLTADGERCYERGKALLASWATFESELRGAGETPEGVLRVVVPHAFGQTQLVHMLADYLRRYPGMQVEWLLHDDSMLGDFIAAGIDCAIQVGEVNDSDLVAIRLAEVPRIAVAAPELLPDGVMPTTLADLAALPWLALRTYYRREICLTQRESGERARIAITPRVSTDSLYALRSAALLGLGAAVGSAWVFAGDLQAGRLVHLLPEWQAAPLPVYLVYPHARYYPARLRCFVAAMREQSPGLFDLGLQPEA